MRKHKKYSGLSKDTKRTYRVEKKQKQKETENKLKEKKKSAGFFNSNAVKTKYHRS